MSFTSVGLTHVLLKSTGEHFSFDRPTTYIKNIIMGTLYVDLVDPGENRAVWHGVASERVREERTPDERRELAEEVVQAMFSTFPPGTSGNK